MALTSQITLSQKEATMDPLALTTLASQVIALLTPLIPFLGKSGEAIATKFGEDAYEEGKHLYKALHDRFAQEADQGKSSRVLQNFTEDPEEYRPNLENKLLVVLQADPGFAAALRQILQSGPVQEMNFADDASVEDTHMSNELGQGTQHMAGGQRATFHNVTMNIGPKKDQERA